MRQSSDILIKDFILDNMYMINNTDLIEIKNIQNPLNYFFNKLLKRVFDIICSIFLFITVFSWLWPMIAVVVKLMSPKEPILFRQERWGKNKKTIFCFKFRTMEPGSKDIDENGDYKQARKNDPRITKIGSFLRCHSLDELPQFINVLKGEMSIIGPRPHPNPLNLRFKDIVDNYQRRHLVKPGITGWAQVNGYRGPTETIESMQRRVDLDLWYIENWNFPLDLKIFFLTVFNLFKKDPMAC